MSLPFEDFSVPIGTLCSPAPDFQLDPQRLTWLNERLRELGRARATAGVGARSYLILPRQANRRAA